MATTAVIVEILVAGFFASLWIALALAIPLFPDRPPSLPLTEYGRWAGIVLFAYTAVCYQLGWVVNWFSYYLLKERTISSIRARAFSEEALDDDEYERRRTLVHQHGSDSLLGELRVELSVVRIARSGVLNYSLLFLTGVVAVLSRGDAWHLDQIGAWLRWVMLGLPLLGTWVCGFQMSGRYRNYYQRMATAYALLSTEMGREGAGDGPPPEPSAR